MAIATSVVRNAVPGDRRESVVDITMDGAYPAGGYPITPQQLGVGAIDTLTLGGVRQGLGWEWDHVNSKLKAYKVGAAGLMVEAAAADVSAANVVRVIVRGRG